MAGKDHQGEHKHGSMDVRDHEKTFAGFIRMTTWGAGICIFLLIFTALLNA
jgi:Ni,Fe-hydrogenase I cytochrome b subunit